MRLSKLNIPTTLRVRTGCVTRLTHRKCLRYRKSCLGQQTASFSSETGASAKEDSFLVQAKADNIVIGDLDATLDAHREQRRQRKQQTSANRVVRYVPHSGQSNETRREGNRELLESTDFPLRQFPKYRLGVESWLKDIRLSRGDGDARLTAELLAFERFVRLDDAGHEACQKITAELGDLLRGLFLRSDIVMIGSVPLGYATPLSNLDLHIRREGHKGRSIRKYADANAEDIATCIKKTGPSGSFNLTRDFTRSTGHVSLLHKATRKRLDILTRPPTVGRQERLELYAEQHPALRAMIHVLHFALKMRGMMRPQDGYLDLYELQLMVVTALKHSTYPIDRLDYGTQLLHVLKFWAEADTRNYAYSLQPPLVHRKVASNMSSQDVKQELKKDVLSRVHMIDLLRLQDPHQPGLLSLYEPLVMDTDVGRLADKIQNVQQFFAYAYEKILQGMASHDKGAGSSTHSVLGPILPTDYKELLKRRRLASDYVQRHKT